ncbi:MAG TPA: hypothetical protein VK212_04505 [Lentimicrobium sp.]|nr:hypothetical protein [Lentimicrobium sp.]
MKKLFLIYFWAISSSLLSQSTSPIKQPVVVPPSPNAFAFAKYGKIPVGTFTGTPQIEIPIYNIIINHDTIPISLKYSSNGLKVDELPSVLGLGWTLNAGGVIIRSVHDLPDVEYERLNYTYYPNQTEEFNDFCYNSMSGNIDTEPDIFSFNFSNFQGKFFLDSLYNPILIKPLPLKIIPSTDYSSAFKIIDPNGTMYFFGGSSATEEMNTEIFVPGNQGAPHFSNMKNAWFLNRIKFFNNEEVNFIYESNFQGYDGGIYNQSTATITEYLQMEYDPANHELPTLFRNTLAARLLSEINWSEGKIVFTYEPLLSTTSTSFERLSSISVYNFNSQLVKKYNLEYQEYETLSSFSNPDNNGFFEAMNQNRVFLTNVIEATSTPSNQYIFTYYYPDGLPPRLSYAQDYWGYFNGKHNNELIPKDLTGLNTSNTYCFYLNAGNVRDLFYQVGGDRKPNFNYGMKGLLKTITYPTGGSTKLEYEPHSVYKLVYQYPEYPTHFLMEIATDSTEWGTTEVIDTTELVPFLQEKIKLDLNILPYDTCGCNEDIPHYLSPKMTLSILKASNQTYITIWKFSEGMGGYISAGNPLVDIDTNFNRQDFFVDFVKDERYIVKLKVTRPCIKGKVSFDYFNEPGQFVNVNEEVGGLRIARIINNSPENETIKKYYYGAFENLNNSSGICESFRPSISYFSTALTDSINPFLYITEYRDKVTIGSSPLNQIYNQEGYHIIYQDVVESIGDNFEGGCTHYKYNSIQDIPPYIICGDAIPETSYTNTFGNGELLRKDYYANEGQLKKIKSEIFNYEDDSRIFNELKAFTCNESLFQNTGDAVFSSYSLNMYKLINKWRYLSNKKTELYSGQDTIITIENYTYDNPNHLQLSSFSTFSSSQDPIMIEYLYPPDFADPLMTTLKNQNRIAEPISIKKYFNNQLIYSKKDTYKEWSNNLVLKEKEQFSLDGNSPLETRIEYNDYNSKGNLIEHSTPGGTHTTYIWGYLNSYPIAKIANSKSIGCGYTGFENNELNGWKKNSQNIFANDKYFTGKASMLVNTLEGPSKEDTVGMDANNHSGYEASVWVIGSTFAYLHIQANDWNYHQRVTNVNGNDTTWKLLRVSLPRHIYRSIINDNLKIKVYVGVNGSGSAHFDNIRFHPMDAQMVTLDYEPLVGVTSESDFNNLPTKYEYDSFNRLNLKRDFEEYILNKYEYHYKQQ